MKTKQTLLLALIISLTFSCSKDEELNTTNENGTENNTEQTDDSTNNSITNYIEKNSIKYNISNANFICGLYDGGPNYYTAIYLNDSNTNFAMNSDDVNSFTGIGTGCFIFFTNADSLINGTYQIDEGWAGINDFNFDNPVGDIYNLNNLPSNFLYLEDKNIVFENMGNNNFSILIQDNDIEIKYEGIINWIE